MTGRFPSVVGVRCSTLVELLRIRAAETPERTAYTFLRDGEREEATLTYQALDAQARSIAAWLQNEGAAGQRALLLYPPGLEFIAAFFGCLYAGVVAVPAYPPRFNRPDPRIREIVADAQPVLALSTETVRSTLEPGRTEGGLAALRWLATDTLPALDERWRQAALDGGSLAFLQYTSGSTASPKGVMVTHANLVHNQGMIARAFGHHDDSPVILSWLPVYHDMGLIGTVLQPLYLGARCVLMPPAAFLQRPLRWLEAITRHRATATGGPNFAYDLCVRKTTPETRRDLDLTSWTVAFNGAEPVHKATLDRFAEAFAPCGFRAEAFAPAYGLAEATLMVSLGRRPEGPVTYRARADELERNRVGLAPVEDAAARTLVGCGAGEHGTEIAIVDPQTAGACRPGEVGEIWLAGPSVAAGYWKRPDETATTFRATLAGSDRGPYLRTGDLGFLAEGELYITGRVKDLVIIRGVNHYPQDIERSAQRSHPALRPDAGAAFSVEIGDEERLVLVQEVDRLHRKPDVDEIVRAIRRAVAEEHEVECQAVVLIGHGSILKTSSGKIQRRACRAAFQDGTLKVVGHWHAPADARAVAPAPAVDEVAAGDHERRSEAAITGFLIDRLARESGIDAEEIDLAQPFASFGLDSARSLMLIGDLETWLGRRVSPVVLWNYPTVEALARHLVE